MQARVKKCCISQSSSLVDQKNNDKSRRDLFSEMKEHKL